MRLDMLYSICLRHTHTLLVRTASNKYLLATMATLMTTNADETREKERERVSESTTLLPDGL